MQGYAESGAIELYSFAVFDTVLTLDTVNFSGIYALMQAELQKTAWHDRLTDFVRHNFVVLREQAGQHACINSCNWGEGDATLARVYEDLGNAGNLTVDTLQDLLTLEKEIVRTHIHGIRRGIAQAMALVALGKRVVLLEDSCYSETFLRELLSLAAPDLAKLPLYVSSACHKAKIDFSLYAWVCQREGVSWEEWQHCGSKAEEDVAVPSRASIRAELFSRESLLPLEEECLRKHPLSVAVQLSVGVCRRLREEKEMGVAERIGCSCMGPVLYAYVQWLLDEALCLGFARLYFIARDGFILQKIANIIIEARCLPLSTYYLYGSRKAWRVQSYDGKKGSLRRMLSAYFPDRITSVEALADVMQVPVEDLRPFCPRHYREKGVALFRWDLAVCIQHLEEQPDFRAWYLEQMRPGRKKVVSYLRQEVDVTDGAFAFVDVQGSGYTENCLSALMGDIHAGSNHVFMFRSEALHFDPHCYIHVFFQSLSIGYLLIELSCRALQGQTEGYRYSGNKMEPVLAEGEQENLRKYGYEDFQAGVCAYAHAYTQSQVGQSGVQLDWICGFLDSMMEHPSLEIQEFFGDMPYSTMGNGIDKAYAPRLTKMEIRNIFLWHVGVDWSRYYEGYSLDFALLRCTPVERRRVERYRLHWYDIKKRYERFTHQKLPRPKYDFKLRMTEMLKLFEGQRIVLYGAGRYGRRMHRYMRWLDICPVQWLDRDSRALAEKGRPVDGDLSALGREPFDVVLIAIADQEIVSQVKRDICSLGLKGARVYGMAEAVDYLSSYFRNDRIYPQSYRLKLAGQA